MSRGYFVLLPGMHWTVTAAPEVIPGVRGVSHFRVNRFGIRGRDFGADTGEYRILAVGGSTTQCTVLDDSEAWPHLLETGLGGTVDGRAVWVGNVGRDGATTRDHVLHLKYLLRQYPRIDVVVSIVGVNDLMSALHQGWAYRLPPRVTEPRAESEQLPRAFTLMPGSSRDGARLASWYRRTALWQLARRVKLARETHGTATMRRGPFPLLQEARLRRQAATTLLDSLPPLEAPLLEYRRNLNTMVDLAAARGARLVFVTQPSLWKQRMPYAEERLLWFGWLGADRSSARTYFTTRALSRAMERYNETLLEVCRERQLACVDAARALPRDTTAVYDDVHFNDHGSELLARVLVAHFREWPPFRSSP